MLHELRFAGAGGAGDLHRAGLVKAMLGKEHFSGVEQSLPRRNFRFRDAGGLSKRFFNGDRRHDHYFVPLWAKKIVYLTGTETFILKVCLKHGCIFIKSK